MTPKMGGVLKNRYLKRHTLMAHRQPMQKIFKADLIVLNVLKLTNLGAVCKAYFFLFQSAMCLFQKNPL